MPVLVVQSEFRHTWSSVDGCRLLPTDWDMSAAEGVWDLLPDASTNLVQAYHLWTITVGETGTSARGAAEAECVLVLQVRRSMHQDCLLNPRNFVSYPFFTHFPPFFAHFLRLDARNPENTTRSPGENGKKSINIG